MDSGHEGTDATEIEKGTGVQEEAEDSDCSTTSYESTSSPSASEDEEELVENTEQFARDLLNFRSINFNPSLALMCDKDDQNLKVPDRSAPVYLNLAHYSKAVSNPSEVPAKEALVNKPVLSSKAKKPESNNAPLLYQPSTQTKNVSAVRDKVDIEGQGAKVEKATTEEKNFPIPGRRFLPHQLPVFQPRKEAPNVKVIMENSEGPLGALSRTMKEKRRVKVWTRNDMGIRGFVTGFVEAFDKHWNLALRDVDEQFLRRRKIKYPTEINPNVRELKDAKEHDRKEKEDTRRRSPRKKRKDSTDRKSQSHKSRSRGPGNKNDESTAPLILGTSEDLVSICRKGLSELNLHNKSNNLARRSRSESKSSRERSLSKRHSSSPKHSSITKSAVRKHRLVIFKTPKQDANGFKVVAQTKKYEVVERHVGQLFLMGNDIVFIETGRNG